ncbi:uncharacterized protein [Aegilops tauschii subsp. strangulata]|uniref:Rieske domain-containing protein n=2 Tax=Triticinae TaxID=1648030 RepID=A0A453EJE5_AEGTS|nr:uncharacterized protein LOC109775305 isoform X1 [Aegilops tauschii subsp. strangulata]
MRGWRRGCVDGKLECLYHGWQFDGQGKCVKIPQVNGAMMWWYNISAAVLQAAFHVEDRVQGRGVSDIVHILLSLFVKLVCTLCRRQALARLMGIGWSMHAGDGGSPRLSSSPARTRHLTTSSIASHEDRARAAVQVSYTRRPLWSPLEGLELGGSLADDGGLDGGYFCSRMIA